MVQARDLLSLLLSASSSSSSQLSSLLSQSATQASQLSQPPSSLPPSPLAATVVTKPAPKVSVRAFNAQLTVGGKDKTLRAAADLFKTAAQQMEESRVSSEKYWADALKIRRANWGLVPAPLPLGSASGKGADKTSKDFLVAFGLEECMTVPLTLTFVAIDSASQHPLSSVAEPSVEHIDSARMASWSFLCDNVLDSEWR